MNGVDDLPPWQKVQANYLRPSNVVMSPEPKRFDPLRMAVTNHGNAGSNRKYQEPARESFVPAWVKAR
jgi:hypothetical protein